MRRTRRLILLLLILIVALVGFVWNNQKELQTRNTPHPEAPLPSGLTAKAKEWVWNQTVNQRTLVEVHAAEFRQTSEEGKLELHGVDLKMFHKDGTAYDRVKSAKADFDTTDGVLFSEGDVEITMGVPEGDVVKPSGKLLVIRSSGVRYESKSGKALTERAASFTFDRGEGKSTGAEYDPATGELRLFKDVVLFWHGQKPTDKTMQIESGNLTYKEKESKVYLAPWSRLKRDTLTMDAAASVVTLDQGVIQVVEAEQARGTDKQPKRQLDYAADHLRMNFDDSGTVQSITGEQNAHLNSQAATGTTAVTTNRVDMDFDTTDGNSILKKAQANGQSQVVSTPATPPSGVQPETRILKAESIIVNMRPGGEEIQNVETHTPGTLEFVPNNAVQKHRTMTGERMWITYGAQNQIQSFRSVNVTTRTDNEAPKGKPPLPPSLTWSKDLSAEFAPNTGQMQKLEQWQDFRYEEGDRKARAQRAVLDYPKNLITLDGPASRVWDSTGSTTADKIYLHQQTGDFEAVGNVSSTRAPDKAAKKDPAGKPPKPKSGMLSSDEPLQAKAAKMTSSDSNLQIHYEGNALMWQGSNRIQAERIDIDRDEQKLIARGNVISQFVEKSTPANDAPVLNADPKVVPVKKVKSSGNRTIFTTIKAPELIYTDEDKLAYYKGGVVLKRPGMDVVSRELRAWLKDSESDSSLDHAFADGAVKIVQVSPDRTRTGTSERAEYYVGEEKVILKEGQPTLVDSVRGTTVGRQLTYFQGDDRLLVDGATAKPAVSNLKRK